MGTSNNRVVGLILVLAYFLLLLRSNMGKSNP